MTSTFRRLFRERGPGRAQTQDSSTPTAAPADARAEPSPPPSSKRDLASASAKPPQQVLLQDTAYVPDSRAASLLASDSRAATWRRRLFRVSATRRTGGSPPDTAAARAEHTRVRLRSAPDQPAPHTQQHKPPSTPARKRASTDAAASHKQSASGRSDDRPAERSARQAAALSRRDTPGRAVGRLASDPFAAHPASSLPAWRPDAPVPSLRGDDSFLRCASSPRTTSPVVSPGIARIIHRDYAFPSAAPPGEHDEHGDPPAPGVDPEWDEVRGQAQAKIASWRERMRTAGSESSVEPCVARIRLLPPLSRSSTLRDDGSRPRDTADSCVTSLLQQQLLALLTHDEALAAAAATAVPDAVDRAGAMRRTSAVQPPRGDAAQRLSRLFRRVPRGSLSASESGLATPPDVAKLGNDVFGQRGTLEIVQSPDTSEAPSSALDSAALCSRLRELESEQELWRKHVARRLAGSGRKHSRQNQHHASSHAEPKHSPQDRALDTAQRPSAKEPVQRQHTQAGPPAPPDHLVAHKRQQRSVSLQFLPVGAGHHAQADAASTSHGETVLGTPTVLYSSLPRTAARPTRRSPSGADETRRDADPLCGPPLATDNRGPELVRSESTPSRVKLWLATAPDAACSAQYAASATATEPSTFERLRRCGSSSPSELTSVSRMLSRNADRSRAHDSQAAAPQPPFNAGEEKEALRPKWSQLGPSDRAREHRRSAEPTSRRDSSAFQAGTRHVHKLDDEELLQLLRGVTPSSKASAKEARGSRGQAPADGAGTSKRGKQVSRSPARTPLKRSSTRDSLDGPGDDRLHAHMLLSTWLQHC